MVSQMVTSSEIIDFQRDHPMLKLEVREMDAAARVKKAWGITAQS